MSRDMPSGSPTSTRSPRQRPPWARRLDRAVGLALRLGGRLLGRPSDALLGELAAADRPGLRLAPDQWEHAESAEMHITAGRAAFEAGQHGEALHHFGLALEASPEATWAWHGRGDALQLLGRHEDALAAYARAATLAPETGLHEAGRANALRALGREEEATEAWSRALTLDPSLRWMRPGQTG